MAASVRATTFLTRFRTPPVALQNVLHGRSRSLAAIAGIGFAVVMVLLELGFLEAVKSAATVNYDQLDFDLALVSTQFEQFYQPGSFPLARLKQCQGVEDIVTAAPLHARMNFWRCPPYPLDGDSDRLEFLATQLSAIDRWWLGDRRPRPPQRRQLLVLGLDLGLNPFREPIRGEVKRARDELRKERRVLFNRLSNVDFGWSLRDQFDRWELGHRAVVIAGDFTLPRSFGADAAVLCTDANFAQFFDPAPGAIQFGLIKVRPGTVDQTVAKLRKLLPADVRPLTRQELIEIEGDYWVRQTATGKIFAFGVFVAMLVAAVVVYQVLSNDVRRRLPEYATLKAMGHTDWFLARVILGQAGIYAMAAFLPALLLGALLYQVTERLANIPMVLTRNNVLLVLGLTLAFSLLSGLLTVRKLRLADPADLY